MSACTSSSGLRDSCPPGSSGTFTSKLKRGSPRLRQNLSDNGPHARIVEKSQAEHHVTRSAWKLPSDAALSKRHPLTAEPLWAFILRRAGVPVSDSATLRGSKTDVERNWQLFLELLGWWEFKRCFNRSGDSVALKPTADIVVIHFYNTSDTTELHTNPKRLGCP